MNNYISGPKEPFSVEYIKSKVNDTGLYMEARMKEAQKTMARFDVEITIGWAF